MTIATIVDALHVDARDRAAAGFSPTARSLKPRLDRLSSQAARERRDDREQESDVHVVSRRSSDGRDRGGQLGGGFGLFDPGACSSGVCSR